MQPVFDSYENWVGGITTSPSADMLPQTFSPRGRNTNLVNVGQGTAQVASRRGMLTSNVTPITGSPTVLGMYQLKRLNGTKFHLLVSDNGRLDKSNADTTTTVINATAFTAGTNYPNFATVNNMAIISNGVNLKKTDGATVWNVGMVRPAAPTAAVAAGGSMSLGLWDVALTYFNSTTGEESSRSDATTVTTVGANLQINVSWVTPPDPQVDFVRVYIRKQSLGSNFYLAIAGLTPAPNATWFGFPIATLATVVNISDTVYGALVIIAPTTTSNNPPAVTLQFPVWHDSRLWLFDSGNAYYSNITNLDSRPESFDPLNVQEISPGDGDVITGAVSAFEHLFIFKRFSTWEIAGPDPSSWAVTRHSSRYGCCGNRTIAMAGGRLYWWSPTTLGLLCLPDVASQPLEIGKDLLASSITPDQINFQALASAVVVVDEANDIIAWALPGGGVIGRNTFIIPYNYRVQKFVAESWNPMDIASFGSAEDLVNTRGVWAGGYAGQIFKWWAASNDGVPLNTTASGHISVGSTTTTLVDSLAAFSTTGGALIERYVYHIPVTGFMQRRRIVSNTATTLTITPAWDSALVVGDSYIIGGIDFQLDTPWSGSGMPFMKKRFEFLYVEASSDQNGTQIYADVFTKGALGIPAKTLLMTFDGTGALYGTGIYGVSTYSATQSGKRRKAIGLTGKSYRIRLRNLQSNIQIAVQRVAVQAHILGSKT